MVLKSRTRNLLNTLGLSPLVQKAIIWYCLENLKSEKENRWEIGYINEDPVLVNDFKELCEKLGSHVHLRPRANCFMADARGMAAGVLKAVGCMEGKKTIVNPELPKPIREDFELWKRHLGFTIAEEGHIGLAEMEHRVRMDVSYSRSVDITDSVPPWFIERLEPGNKYLENDLEHLLGERWSEIEPIVTDSKKASKLLKDEVDTFNRFHNAEVKELKCNFDALHFSKKRRVTAIFCIDIRSKRNIDLIAQHYRPPEGTWKRVLFDKYYDFYLKHRGKKLSDEDLKEFNELKREYPSGGVPEWWKRQRLSELGWKFE